jgi:hypothetical protein
MKKKNIPPFCFADFEYKYGQESITEVLNIISEKNLSHMEILAIGTSLLGTELAKAVQQGAISAPDGLRILMKNVLFQVDLNLSPKDTIH